MGISESCTGRSRRRHRRSRVAKYDCHQPVAQQCEVTKSVRLVEEQHVAKCRSVEVILHLEVEEFTEGRKKESSALI